MGYLFTFLKPDHAYYQHWLEFRRRRRAYFLGFFAFPVVFLLTAAPSTLILYVLSLPESFALIPVVAGCGVWANYLWQQLRWPCPRCGKPFMFGRFGVVPWTSACGNCGLPTYSPCDPVDQKLEFESHQPGDK